mgnify:CR=1 FL=1
MTFMVICHDREKLEMLFPLMAFLFFDEADG